MDEVNSIPVYLELHVTCQPWKPRSADIITDARCKVHGNSQDSPLDKNPDKRVHFPVTWTHSAACEHRAASFSHVILTDSLKLDGVADCNT